jgi:hypothetical protein
VIKNNFGFDFETVSDNSYNYDSSRIILRIPSQVRYGIGAPLRFEELCMPPDWLKERFDWYPDNSTMDPLWRTHSGSSWRPTNIFSGPRKVAYIIPTALRLHISDLVMSLDVNRSKDLLDWILEIFPAGIVIDPMKGDVVREGTTLLSPEDLNQLIDESQNARGDLINDLKEAEETILEKEEEIKNLEKELDDMSAIVFECDIDA